MQLSEGVTVVYMVSVTVRLAVIVPPTREALEKVLERVQVVSLADDTTEPVIASAPPVVMIGMGVTSIVVLTTVFSVTVLVIAALVLVQ